MSANDILDVLNIQRDVSEQNPKKKQKVSHDVNRGVRQSGMARELYNLIGPNTPPVNISSNSLKTGIKNKLEFKPSPWSNVPFKVSPKSDVVLHHWVRGSKELLEQEDQDKKPYIFDKFNVKLDLPEFVDQSIYEEIMNGFKAGNDNTSAIEATDSTTDTGTSTDKGTTNEASSAQDLDYEKQKSDTKEHIGKIDSRKFSEWNYEETKLLFELCKCFELKWPIIYDRFPNTERSLEDLKEHFYTFCKILLQRQENGNSKLLESLSSYSKANEIERKQYLENLLRRTPAEIAEEESLVIEARRFELAAKKMLIERSHLLTLLDSPQASQSIQQYQSSQGLTNLYNNLMIIDRNNKKRLLQQQKLSSAHGEPTPPSIPIAASSSFKKEKNFQTHLQQYLAGFLKQNISTSKGPNAIQQLLSKRLTVKEEEAYGLHYHSSEKLTPGVILRSSQKLPGLQQRQSVLKSVNSVLQELNIGTAGTTSWKPVMPTRKTMSKYDELLRAIVTLLDVKKARDKMEAEISLIKGQRDLQ